ncbi:MAG: hypothetical protein L6R38_005948 [Xanthoria sp. 2 TBL-2021]|nr:MAG: hypothetical protein L6R38_005948 [Xanthoria sp. 2 TBL-2021]
MIDADPLAVGPAGRIGICRPFELDCYLVAKRTKFDIDEDRDLFSFDHFFAVLKHVDHNRYGLMTKKVFKDALKNAKNNDGDYFIRWDRFRNEYLAYLLSRIKVENPFEPRNALDRIIAGLRRNLSYGEVAMGLNRLHRQQRDPQRPQEIIQEYLKFSRHDAYLRWNAVAYDDPEFVRMADGLTA